MRNLASIKCSVSDVMSSAGNNLPKGWLSTSLGDLYTFEYGKSLIKGARDTTGRFPVYGSSGVVGMHDHRDAIGIAGHAAASANSSASRRTDARA